MKVHPREARALLRQCDFGALATHSAKMPGFPFVSHAPFMLDGAGRPLLLLSKLAEHTRNLAQDPRASLMATVAGPDPQEQPRLTLLGEVAPVEVSSALVERYLRYHPEAATFLGFGDFGFFRMAPQRIRVIGGFAQAGWIEGASWRIEPVEEGRESVLVGELADCVPAGWQVLGMDREGLDLRSDADKRLRVGWSEAVADETQLLALAREALGRPTAP